MSRKFVFPWRVEHTIFDILDLPNVNLSDFLHLRRLNCASLLNFPNMFSQSQQWVAVSTFMHGSGGTWLQDSLKLSFHKLLLQFCNDAKDPFMPRHDIFLLKQVLKQKDVPLVQH